MLTFSLRRLFWIGLLMTVLAIAINSLYYGLSRLAGETYPMPLNGTGSRIGPMPILMPVIATALLGLTATLFFVLLVRFTRQPVVIFVSVAFTALLVSFGGPLSLPEVVPLRTRLLLCGMHVLTAAVIVLGLLRWGPVRKR
jgi:hypothetical protein